MDHFEIKSLKDNMIKRKKKFSYYFKGNKFFKSLH